MVHQPKNKIHMSNPMLLQQPIFRGMIFCIPLLEGNADNVIDLVRRNGQGVLMSGMPWSRDEYGPNVIPTGNDYILTGCPTSQISMSHWTLMFWGATTDSSSNKIYTMGFWHDANLSIEFGRRSNNPGIVVNTALGYNNVNGSAPGHNDGNIHCFMATSDDTTIRVYVDGVEVASDGSIDDEAGNAATYFRVGYTGSNVAWDGTMSFGAGWNRGLSPVEVYELYRMGPGLQILSEEIISPFSAAVGAGTPAFIPAWAINSNQVLL